MVEVGDDAPDFRLVNTQNDWVTGAEHRGQRVVLAFFPAAFTGVCTTELCTFQESLAKLNEANATIYGISVDARFSNAAFAEANGVEFEILSDYTRETVRAYGIELDDFAGMPGYTASHRAVFIVDGEGNISYKWVGENPGIEPNYDEVLAALDA